MENKLLITQALDERDLLVKKINSKIERIDFVDGKKRNEEKVIQQVITKEEFCKKDVHPEAREYFEQVINRFKI